MNVDTVPHITGWHITWMLVQFHTLPDDITWMLVLFHTVPDDTTSHECWYSSTHYRMTQHHMNVGRVLHFTGWQNITWMLALFHTLPDDTSSHEFWYSSIHYQMTHHMNVGTVPHFTRWHNIIRMFSNTAVDLNCCPAIYCFIATCYCNWELIELQ